MKSSKKGLRFYVPDVNMFKMLRYRSHVIETKFLTAT